MYRRHEQCPNNLISYNIELLIFPRFYPTLPMIFEKVCACVGCTHNNTASKKETEKSSWTFPSMSVAKNAPRKECRILFHSEKFSFVTRRKKSSSTTFYVIHNITRCHRVVSQTHFVSNDYIILIEQLIFNLYFISI